MKTGMRAWRGLLAAACIALTSVAPARAQQQELYHSEKGPHAVTQVDKTWRDESRQRDIPVRMFLPEPVKAEDAKEKAPPEKMPVIVFSHGLGGSRTSYSHFGQHMASWGYIVILPTHEGSDTAAMAAGTREQGFNVVGGDGWMRTSIEDPKNLRNRPLDVEFVIDQLSKDGALKDIADASRVGVAGHSFGAHTAMQIGGMTINLPDEKDKSFREPRVKAVLPMSPEGPGTMGIVESSWAKFGVPVMYLTGTRDYGQGERSAAWRRAGFEHVSGEDDYLVTLNGAGHMTFAGREATATPPKEDAKPATDEGGGGGARDRLRERAREREAQASGSNRAHHLEMIHALSAAFFDTYLCDDAKAKEWLKTYMAAKHDDCTAEFKAGAEKK